jgi:hypothetical protein
MIPGHSRTPRIKIVFCTSPFCVSNTSYLLHDILRYTSWPNGPAQPQSILILWYVTSRMVQNMYDICHYRRERSFHLSSQFIGEVPCLEAQQWLGSCSAATSCQDHRCRNSSRLPQKRLRLLPCDLRGAAPVLASLPRLGLPALPSLVGSHAPFKYHRVLDDTY